MSCLVTQPAPEFTAQAVMPDGQFQQVNLSDYQGKYVLLFFYPLDFTFVCPTEIIAFSEAAEEFKKRNVELLGVSIDSHFSHFAWRNTPRTEGGIGPINYPLVSDLSKQIATDYGVLLGSGVALRGLFLIDKEGVVRHELVNDLPLGRSVDEALRLIDALQYTEEHGEVCPANWKVGSAAMTPDTEKSKDYFQKSYATSS